MKMVYVPSEHSWKISMKNCKFEKGLAFIVEGDTERVFYEEYLTKVCVDREIRMSKDEKSQENKHILTKDDRAILVMIDNVSSVTQMPNSAMWFRRACLDSFNEIPWHVFLGYDTDDYSGDITKFYKDDWLYLRQEIEKDAASVTDLAAKADIEDIMLYDLEGVLAFLGLNPDTKAPSGRKGKAKMRKLFRMVSTSNAYHEGERARDLIRSLNMEKLEASAPIPLSSIGVVLNFD